MAAELGLDGQLSVLDERGREALIVGRSDGLWIELPAMGMLWALYRTAGGALRQRGAQLASMATRTGVRARVTVAGFPVAELDPLAGGNLWGRLFGLSDFRVNPLGVLKAVLRVPRRQ